MENTIISLNTKVKELMTSDFTSVTPNTRMSEIRRIFEEQSFHHLPVLDEKGAPVGIISRSDYNKLLHHFTLFGYKDAEVNNERFFRSLIAEDIMKKNPICVLSDTTIKEALKMFMVNKFHSLLVKAEGKCIGIITPFDFLELILEQ